ncbi:MAG: ATP-binding cassette domain-containing protein [Chromatiales bacterium]|jgi:ABC-2 type transport system ATP-binding protein
MIRVSDLIRTYGDLTAVNKVSFGINQGEIVGLLGHNGAGKTTIMKMLTGYLEPTAGSIEIDGLDIANNRKAVQQRIGYLPENDPLYPEMTVIDYLDYAAELHGVPADDRLECIWKAIERAGLADRAADRIATLSRGYRQRVGVAQAIIHNPRLLILDEPTNGLDPTQVQQMRELIRSLAQHATVILSTHILQEVQAICDRVIIIRNGRKALDATMEELRAGKRLLVSVDAAPERALDLFRSLQGVKSVETLNTAGVEHRYALDLERQEILHQTAPELANRVTAQGMKLYALQPESRNLETIFGEISAQQGR